MKLCKNREELYFMLWNDYLDFKRKEVKSGANKKEYIRESLEQCFIYSYYQSRKTKMAEEIAVSAEELEKYRKNSRPDKFVLLCASRILWKNKKLSDEEYGGIFEDIANHENNGEHYKSVFGKDPEQAYDELSYHLLCGIIQDKFLKMGYRQPKYDENGMEISAPARKAPTANKKGGYNTDEIELLYKYSEYLENDGVYVNKASELTEKHKETCAKLYECLRTIDARGVFIPLYVDPSSGAGVYIIGDKNFSKPHSTECHVYILSFFGCDEDNDCPEDYSDWTTGEFSFKIEKYEDVWDAFDSLENNLNNAFEPYCENYTEYNKRYLSGLLSDNTLGNELEGRFAKFMADRDNISKFKEKQDQIRINKMLKKEQEALKRYEK